MARLLQAAKKLAWQGVLYQGTSLLVPQTAKNDMGFSP
jgi:hypothetical protein